MTKKAQGSFSVNVMNFCWCADPSHLLFHPLAGRVQVESERKPLLLQREYSRVVVNSPSTTVKWLRSHGQSLQCVHDRCIFPSTGTVLKPPVGGGSSAVLSGLHHLAAVLDRDPPASH